MRAVKQDFIALILMPVLIAGCATQEVKVSCDGKLQPINPPRDSQGGSTGARRRGKW